jgi:DNA polymerase
MGVETWYFHDPAKAAIATPVEQDLASDQDRAESDKWTDLASQVATCEACALSQGRTQTVFGVGNKQADLLFVGEAPGFHEDRLGEPFVGKAGQLLTAMLAAIDLTREQVFIANILKCRPPNNRDPDPSEVAAFTSYLKAQIQLLQPKLIVALGRIAAHWLLETNAPLSRLRSQRHTYADSKVPLLVTYHPAYLLRNPRDKCKAWQDWQEIRIKID